MRYLTIAALLAMTTATGRTPDQSGTFSLASATWMVDEALSNIHGVATFRDGRVLIADSRERLLYVASRDGRLTRYGSAGEGPGEYQSVYSITRVRGDSLLVFDARNRRFLRFTAEGRQVQDVSIPTELLRAGGIAPVTGSDANGRLYWVGDVVGTEGGLPKRAAVHRIRAWTPGQTAVTIVAPLRDHADDRHAQAFHPFSARDAYVIAPDGRVGVLSATDYRLRWYRDNRIVAEGPPIPYAKVRLTAAERSAFRRARAGQPAGGISMSGGGSRDEPSPEAMRRMTEAYPDALFPDALPPFDADAVRRSPRGDVWVTLSAPSAATQVMVDVLREDGTRRGSLRLPTGRRLVSLAPEGIYLKRVDDDGLEWLERYAYPAGLN